MRSRHLQFTADFRPVLSNARAQIAEMTIAPGDSEGDSGNRHKGADQWLFVVAGSGIAISRTRRIALKPHTLLLIEAGDIHEIRNNGRTPLKTVNFYAPPAYAKSGRPLPRGRRS
jgi:mannose-6-phosphate isomerase-like protein (cupin superfamily)